MNTAVIPSLEIVSGNETPLPSSPYPTAVGPEHRRGHAHLFSLILLGVISGCLQQPIPAERHEQANSLPQAATVAPAAGAVPISIPRDQITQISIINALMLGQYDGIIPFEELLRYGDFGVGTLNQLDGELIVLNGQGYQVHGDGSINKVAPTAKIPFAVVTPFDQAERHTLPQIESLEKLDEHLDEAIGHPNQFIAIRIHAEFATITLRSVKAQSPPYRPLSVAAKEQSVWTREKVVGTLIGIRCPAWVQGLNVPGFHWHFLSDDLSVGGHVLKCQAGAANADYDVCREWLVRLVDSPGFDAIDLHKDLNRELRSVESARDEAAPVKQTEQ